MTKEKWFFRGICVDFREFPRCGGAVLATVNRADGMKVGWFSA